MMLLIPLLALQTTQSVYSNVAQEMLLTFPETSLEANGLGGCEFIEIEKTKSGWTVSAALPNEDEFPPPRIFSVSQSGEVVWSEKARSAVLAAREQNLKKNSYHSALAMWSLSDVRTQANKIEISIYGRDSRALNQSEHLTIIISQPSHDDFFSYREDGSRLRRISGERGGTMKVWP